MDELREWLSQQIAWENEQGQECENLRDFDNGLQSTVHYQRSAAYQKVLTRLDQMQTHHTFVCPECGRLGRVKCEQAR